MRRKEEGEEKPQKRWGREDAKARPKLRRRKKGVEEGAERKRSEQEERERREQGRCLQHGIVRAEELSP